MANLINYAPSLKARKLISKGLIIRLAHLTVELDTNFSKAVLLMNPKWVITQRFHPSLMKYPLPA